jgi:dTDP-4-amino-4,6-dideoxygalactose transaminase
MQSDGRVPVMAPVCQDPALSLPRLQAVHKSGIFSNFGPQVKELEFRIANQLNVPPERVVMAANATLGLSGSMAVSPAKEWRIPSWTFAATGHAAKGTSLPFQFEDVSEDTWRQSISDTYSEHIGQVLVLQFGAPLSEISWAENREVVIDGAASFGSLAASFPDLPHSTSLVISFHATKVLGVGEGAVVIFGDSQRASSFRKWTNFGFTKSRDSLRNGTNAKMSEYTAALLHGELDAWDSARESWLNAKLKADAVSRRLGLDLPPGLEGTLTPYWIVLFQDELTRKAVESTLDSAKIGHRRWWGSGLHKMPVFENVPFESLAVTDDLASRYLGLPLSRTMTDDDFQTVERALQEALRQ